MRIITVTNFVPFIRDPAVLKHPRLARRFFGWRPLPDLPPQAPIFIDAVSCRERHAGLQIAGCYNLLEFPMDVYSPHMQFLKKFGLVGFFGP